MAEKQAGQQAKIKSPQRTKVGKKAPAETLFTWPFGKRNLYVVLAGIVCIVLGYVFLGIGPYDSVASMSIAPIFLVIGYLVLLPMGLIISDPSKEE
ncbi:hypothetical protein K8I28_11625 [bacterium]|nr:hypothetical protein [bacterium]